MKFIERENGIIEVMKKLAGFNIIVVGGYAVSARAMHRFSVDCDIVIRKDDLEKIAGVLAGEGFERTVTREGFDNEYGGEFVRYAKKIDGLPVSIDLLVSSLVCRTTGASWGFDYMLGNSDRVIIAGVESSIECTVPSRELLLAFKIHSARKTDLRDIVMLRDADWNAVKNHLNRGDMAVLKRQIESMISVLDDKDLIDSLKGEFQLKGDAGKMMRDTKRKLADLLDGI